MNSSPDIKCMRTERGTVFEISEHLPLSDENFNRTDAKTQYGRFSNRSIKRHLTKIRGMSVKFGDTFDECL